MNVTYPLPPVKQFTATVYYPERRRVMVKPMIHSQCGAVRKKAAGLAAILTNNHARFTTHACRFLNHCMPQKRGITNRLTLSKSAVPFDTVFDHLVRDSYTPPIPLSNILTQSEIVCRRLKFGQKVLSI